MSRDRTRGLPLAPHPFCVLVFLLTVLSACGRPSAECVVRVSNAGQSTVSLQDLRVNGQALPRGVVKPGQRAHLALNLPRTDRLLVEWRGNPSVQRSLAVPPGQVPAQLFIDLDGRGLSALRLVAKPAE